MGHANARTGSDTYVKSSAASANWRGATRLHVESPGADTRYAYLFFKNPAPRGATVLTATLHLFSDGFGGGSPTVSVQRVGNAWGASKINYTNRPGLAGAVVSLTQADTAAAEWAFDVTAQIQTMCDGSANYGWRLSTTATADHRFYSLNASDNRPYLEVEWSDAPDAPDELSPAGGSAVSVASPTLTFNFFDVAGSTRMASCQVQINSSNSWTSPAFDSGEVATSDPELDLTTTAYAGLAVGSTAWWRVRVKDAAGVWSAYSDATSWTRTAKGTLTLNSPTGGHVNDPTQEVLWTLTGATQTGWRITIWDDGDVSSWLWDSGRRNGNDSAFTLPKGVITEEATVYRLRVRVWDVLGRVSTPNDKSHTEVVTTFTYNDGTGVPVTGLTAFQQNNGSPHVVLQWQRATAPDSFAISRNGGFIDTDLDPADQLVSGTTYQYIDKTAPPSKSLTYKVRSKVSGSGLTPGATVTFEYTLADVWLMDPDQLTTRLVPVRTSLADCQFSMGEVSGSYQPVDGDTPAVFVQGQQGLSGTIVGRITAVPRSGITASAAVADMLWFKKHPDNVVRMSIGAQNLRVRIHNVTVAPLATLDVDARQVSFDFVSLDGPAQ